jgi:hypothetical protein
MTNSTYNTNLNDEEIEALSYGALSKLRIASKTAYTNKIAFFLNGQFQTVRKYSGKTLEPKVSCLFTLGELKDELSLSQWRSYVIERAGEFYIVTRLHIYTSIDFISAPRAFWTRLYCFKLHPKDVENVIGTMYLEGNSITFVNQTEWAFDCYSPYGTEFIAELIFLHSIGMVKQYVCG